MFCLLPFPLLDHIPMITDTLILRPALCPALSLMAEAAGLLLLQEMLDMLRDHQNNVHGTRLEWIVIWLIFVELLVGLLEVLGLFGLVGHE